MDWKTKLWDSLIDRNVFYTILFLVVISVAVPPDRRELALGALGVLAFTGGTAKTIMNGVKAKAAIDAGGPATSSSTTTTTTSFKGDGEVS